MLNEAAPAGETNSSWPEFAPRSVKYARRKTISVGNTDTRTSSVSSHRPPDEGRAMSADKTGATLEGCRTVNPRTCHLASLRNFRRTSSKLPDRFGTYSGFSISIDKSSATQTGSAPILKNPFRAYSLRKLATRTTATGFGTPLT